MLYSRILEWPFEAKRLHRLQTGFDHLSWADARGTIDWILRHQDPAIMRTAIRSAWQESALPLSPWAADICSVAPVYYYGMEDSRELPVNLRLRVTMESDIGYVEMQAPMDEDVLARAISKLPIKPPAIMCEFARTAPGLSFPKVEELALTAPTFANQEFFLRRLEYVTRWCKEVGIDFAHDPDPSPEEGMYLPRPDRYLMELAYVESDAFLLANDGHISFFTHEESCCYDCEVGIDVLVRAFFKDQRLPHPVESDWTVYKIDPRIREIQALEHQIESAIGALPLLAAIAVACKAMARDARVGYRAATEESMRTYRTNVDQIVSIVTRVCMRGETIDESTGNEIVADSMGTINALVGSCFRGTTYAMTDWEVSSIRDQFVASITCLLRACEPVCEPANTIYWLKYFAAGVVTQLLLDVGEPTDLRPLDDVKLLARATCRDIDLARDLSLGDADSVGRPVSSTFFDLTDEDYSAYSSGTP